MKTRILLLVYSFLTIGSVLGQTNPAVLKIESIVASPETICVGDSSQLNVEVSGGQPPYFYSWSPINTLSSSTIKNPIAHPAETTEYTVVVTDSETSHHLTKAQVSGSVTVTVNSLPSAAVSGGGTVCMGSSQVAITFTGTHGSPPYIFAYTINMGDTLYTSAGPSPVTIYQSASTSGIFNYTLIAVSDGNQCSQLQTGSALVTVNPPGQVDDPGDQALCHGSSTSPVNFTTSNTGGTTTFSWTNNNTSINLPASGTGDIGSFTANNAGLSPEVATITVTPHYTALAVTCDGPTENFRITVYPSGQVNQPENQTVCSGSETAAVFFTSENTGGTVVYTWTNNHPEIGLEASGIGSIASFMATNPNIAPLNATIEVTPHFYFQPLSFCTGTPENFTITANSAPEADFNADNVCIGSTTAFTDLSNNGEIDIDTWLWEFGDNSTSTKQNPTHKYAIPGQYTVQLTVEVTGQDCPGAREKLITVYSFPDADFNFENVCDNEPVSFHDISTNATGAINLRKWNFGDGSVSSEQNPTYTYLSAGEYNVKLLVTAGDAACADSVSKTVQVYNLPSFQIAGPAEVCRNLKNAEYIIDNLQFAVLADAEISWETSNGLITGETESPVIQVDWSSEASTGGVRSAITNMTTGCISPLNEFPVAISSTYTAPEPETIVVKTLDGEPILLIYPEPGFIYSWYNNNIPIAGANLQYYYPGTGFNPDEYKVYLEPEGDFGEFKCGNFAYPDTTTGNQKIFTFRNDEMFLIYPNPVSDLLNVVVCEKIAGTDYRNIELRISGLTGKTILAQKITSRETSVKVNHFPRGLYFVEVIVSGQQKQVKKFTAL